MWQICEHCGTKYNDNIDEDCPGCGWHTGIEDEEDPDYEDIYEDKPAGCIACGNDAWPRCQSACPMFDD